MKTTYTLRERIGLIAISAGLIGAPILPLASIVFNINAAVFAAILLGGCVIAIAGALSLD